MELLSPFGHTATRGKLAFLFNRSSTPTPDKYGACYDSLPDTLRTEIYYGIKVFLPVAEDEQ